MWYVNVKVVEINFHLSIVRIQFSARIKKRTLKNHARKIDRESNLIKILKSLPVNDAVSRKFTQQTRNRLKNSQLSRLERREKETKVGATCIPFKHQFYDIVSRRSLLCNILQRPRL